MGKTRGQGTVKGQAKEGSNLSLQPPPPLALGATGKIGPPPDDGGPPADTAGYDRDRELETGPMAPRTTPQYHPAVRATVTAQENRTGKTEEPGGNKTMTPHPAMATGAAGGAGPKKIAPLGKNLLDVNGNQEYQKPTPYGDCNPCREGVGSLV